MSQKKVNILVVDDHPIVMRSIEICFSDCNVVGAESHQEAQLRLAERKFDCIVMDIFLKGGMRGDELAVWYRKHFPDSSTILISSSPQYSCKIAKLIRTGVVENALDKNAGLGIVVESIKTVIWKRSLTIRERGDRFSFMSRFFPYCNSIILAYRTGDEAFQQSSVEKNIGILAADGEYTTWVGYNSPENPRRFVVCVASSVGCDGGCLMCQSMERPFVRPFSIDEIVEQVYYGIDGIFAKPIWQGIKNCWDDCELAINFTCEGDAIVTNLVNTCEAIRRLRGIVPGASFIITTRGDEQMLAMYEEHYASEFTDTDIYCSFHFPIQSDREKYMPATIGQSIQKTRDTLLRIAEKSGRLATIAIALAPGINDTDVCVSLIAEYFAGFPILFKITKMEPGSLPGIDREATDEEVDDFVSRLIKAGIEDVRIRKVGGRRIKASCGLTAPPPYSVSHIRD